MCKGIKKDKNKTKKEIRYYYVHMLSFKLFFVIVLHELELFIIPFFPLHRNLMLIHSVVVVTNFDILWIHI